MTDRSIPSRRSVLSVGAVAVTAAGTVSACSSEQIDAAGSSAANAAGQAAASAADQAGDTVASAAAGAASAAASVAQGAISQLKDIPVGGARALEVAGKPVVLTQPTAGEVHAFSAVCPHQGCTVAPGDAALVCPCHGSTFDLDGNVTQGPATKNLTPLNVSVSSNGITVN